jgi:hypothetical protein
MRISERKELATKLHKKTCKCKPNCQWENFPYNWNEYCHYVALKKINYMFDLIGEENTKEIIHML